MLLTPTELERLTIFNAAELSRRRRARGLKLNCPEAIAFIVDEILEGARDGRTVADMIAFGSQILNSDDVLPGVAALMPMIQIEASFPDGTKLVTVHDPIRPGPGAQMSSGGSRARIPGEIIPAEGSIEVNAGRRSTTLKALNTGDRPIQIGSHFHFFEVNRALDFDRALAWGMHLDIAAGTAVRFEPGESKEVTLVAFGGTGEVFGLNRLTEGASNTEAGLADALVRARQAGFRGA